MYVMFWHFLRIQSINRLYWTIQVSTPILELSQIYEKTLGDDSDIVGKELFSFVDKGDDRLTLRPEGTAGKGSEVPVGSSEIEYD